MRLGGSREGQASLVRTVLFSLLSSFLRHLFVGKTNVLSVSDVPVSFLLHTLMPPTNLL